jgi:N-acylglucosamine 2-epimerase
MRRRNFLSTMAVGGLAAIDPSGRLAAEPAGGKWTGARHETHSMTQPVSDVAPRAARSPQAPAAAVQKIGRWPLQEIRDHFQRELETDVIAFWEKTGVDREYGAYLVADKKTGSYLKTDKDLYSQGRILWIFSYLYNNFGGNPAHLEAARQGKEALVKHCLLPDGHWGTLYARDWTMKQAFFDIYADIYMILGLAEYFKASGDEDAWRLAVRTSYIANEKILAPDYQGQGHGPFYEPGIKRLGTWVHFLFPLTLLLRYKSEEGLEPIARMCVRNMVQYHWDRKEGFAYECLDQLYRPYPVNYLGRFNEKFDFREGFISGWHSIQAAYKIMLEALRIGSRGMFEDGLEFGFQIFKTHWKDTPPCGFNDFQDVEELRKGRGIQSAADPAIYDFLLFALLAIEHTLAPRAMECFEKAYACALSRPEGIFTGSLTLHEPRGVMFAIQILDRLIARGGHASDFLQSRSSA